MKNSNAIIDIFKFLFAICVIFIHTELYLKIKYGFYIHQMIFRLAVPFFFICSGYFLSKSKNDKQRLIKNLKRMLKVYILGGTVYLFANYFFYNLTFDALLENAKRFILLSADNIMWFIGSIIFSIIILYFLRDNKKFIIISILLAFILYLIGLSFTSYNFLYRPANIRIFTNNLQTFFWNCRNPLFSGYLYYSIGYYLGLNNIKISKKKLIFLFILFTIFLFFEVNIIKNHLYEITQYEFLLNHIFVATLLFLILINININKNYKIFRKMSTYMFYSHMLIIYLLKGTKFDKVILFDLTVLFVTIVLSYIEYLIMKLYKYNREVIK